MQMIYNTSIIDIINANYENNENGYKSTDPAQPIIQNYKTGILNTVVYKANYESEF